MASIVVSYPPNTFHSAGPIEIVLSVEGILLDTAIYATPIEIVLSIEGGLAVGTYIDAGAIPIEITLHSDHFVIEPAGGRSNWVKWSKIGYLDFTIDESNVAGERPVDWKGFVNEILKLDKSVVVYGANGVSILTPASVGSSYTATRQSVHMGMKTIHRIGMVCKPVGTEFEHYFIDKTYKLHKLSGEGIQLLDYSEFLSTLTNPRMSLDPENGLLYICDGVSGFVYSTRYPSFGKGPINVTGIGSQSGVLYVTAPEEIEIPKLHITTDIYDLGTRKPKTLQWVEIGTDLTVGLQAMVETRISNKADFIKSKWFLVNPSGIAYIPCYGVEFRFQLKSFIYEYMELDYIKVTGVIHGSSMMEQVQ